MQLLQAGMPSRQFQHQLHLPRLHGSDLLQLSVLRSRCLCVEHELLLLLLLLLHAAVVAADAGVYNHVTYMHQMRARCT